MVCIEDKRKMRIERNGKSKCILDKHLPCSIGNMIATTHDMRDTFISIINDNGEMEYRLIERTCNDEISKIGNISRDVATDNIGKCNWTTWILEADYLFPITRCLWCLF